MPDTLPDATLSIYLDLGLAEKSLGCSPCRFNDHLYPMI